MPKLFILDVETDSKIYQARFRLSDGTGATLASHEIQISPARAFDWEGIFDTQNHVARYAGNLRAASDAKPVTAAQLLDKIGGGLGDEVLGAEIIQALHHGIGERVLLIRLPNADDDSLAAAFARVPWELARPDELSPPLLARNVAIRAD